MGLWNALDASDKIAAISLIVACASLLLSMVVAFYAHRQAKRISELSTFPNLNFSFTNEFRQRARTFRDEAILSYFDIQLLNLSTQAHIKDIEVTVRVSRPLRSWQFWKTRWLSTPFFRERIENLAPNQEQMLSTSSIEIFLSDNLPGFLRLKEKEFPDLYPGRKIPYCEVCQGGALRIFLTIQYTPGLFHANRLETAEEYTLTPQCDGESTQLHAWRLSARRGWQP